WNRVVLTPPTSPEPTPRIVTRQQADYDDKQIAPFGELSYDITERLNAAFSFRWFKVDQTSVVTGEGFQFLSQGTTRDSNTDRKFTPRFNLSWQATDDQLYYATVAEGFRTGILPRDLPQAICGQELANAGFPDCLEPTDKDTTLNYEIGAKMRFADRRVTVNAAAYRIKWKDVQGQVFMTSFAPNPAFSQCNSDAILNVGDAEIDGAELELSAQLTETLRLDMALSYTDATWTRAIPQYRVSPGDRVENTPDWLAFVGLQQGFNLFGRDAYVRVDWNYVGEKPRKPGDFVTQEQPFKIGDYSIVGLRASVALGERQRAELWVDNLFNEYGVTWALDTGGFTAPTMFPVRPRAVGLTLRWDF
ncbi:MAG: TonB-dependent receptor, partial [Rhodobacteraceae bacterium]|nr:TonB-dependent receptor [Paracoccaceae bacterium]